MPYGGYGDEFYGDPIGGGALNLVRARALKGRVVRCVFNLEPLTEAPSGRFDATNPANYVFTAITGQLYGQAWILAVGVDLAAVRGPGFALDNDTQWGMDVHTDRQLVVGMQYGVRVYNLKSRVGDLLGSPYNTNFYGVVPQKNVVPARAQTALTDIANDQTNGTWLVDASGDLQLDSNSLKKRIMRRVTTTLSGFTWLPAYGIPVAVKDVANAGQLQGLKASVTSQLLQEPEITAVDVSISLNQLGVLYINIKARTTGGQPLSVGVTRLADGSVQ